MDTMQGFVLLAKPAGISSTVCVARVKRLVGRTIKVGHSGTLDTFATGLMIIGISRTATRLMDRFLTLDKKYRAVGKLGERTDTFDPTGTIIRVENPPLISQHQLNHALTSFGSCYEQIPPIFSALKYQGKRISTLARKGYTPEQLDSIAAEKKRLIHIHDLSLYAYNAPFFTIDAHVSHGTYIRSLVDDIGIRLGSCATTYALERTQIGPFKLEQAISLADLVASKNVQPHLIAVAEMEKRILL